MRSQPSLAGTLVTVVKVLTSLLVLEDPAVARPKIGVTNQWLHVRDPKGYEGYVAAWYVVLDTTTPPSDGGTTPSPPPPAGELVVYVSSLAYNGLRMRSGPTTGTAILKVLMPNSPLTVLESNADAKVGVFNQWLNVRDSSGTEGYVAAWYVHK
jgi:SH3-like domain-containing protein